MLIADILHSCANEHVAEAAVASMGGAFSEAFGAAAERREMGPGALAVLLVRRFASEATERDWRHVTTVIGASDIPVLCGLRVILERMLERSAAGDGAAVGAAVGNDGRVGATARDAVSCGAPL